MAFKNESVAAGDSVWFANSHSFIVDSRGDDKVDKKASSPNAVVTLLLISNYWWLAFWDLHKFEFIISAK